MAESADRSSPASASAKGRAKKYVVTLLKIAIAVIGIWYVSKSLTWSDSAILKAGVSIRTYTFEEDTPVTVLSVSTNPDGNPLARIDFTSKPVKLAFDTPDGKQHHVEMVLQNGAAVPESQDHLADWPPLEIPQRDLKVDAAGAEPIHAGMRSLLITASGKWYLLLGAWALLGIQFFVTAIRWRNLMIPQGIDMPLGKCLQLTFVGQFYSIMLPGITGGDLVKIVYAARLTGSKTKSFITVILDRVIGLIALMAIAGASAGIQLALNHRAGIIDNTLFNVFLMILAMLAVFAMGATVYFSRRLRRMVGIEWFVERFGAGDSAEVQHARMERLFRVVNIAILVGAVLGAGILAALHWGMTIAWAQRNPTLVLVGIGAAGIVALAALLALAMHAMLVNRMAPLMKKAVGALVNVDETLHVYRGHFGLLIWAFGISLLSQLTLPVSAWLCGMSFGMAAPMTHFLAYVPVAVLAASLPISPPQGFGVMDWLLLHFFVERGTARAGQAFALAQGVRFLPLLWNLVGSYWVVTGSYSRQKVEEEDRAMEQVG